MEGSLYDRLGVPESAVAAEIRRAYLDRARQVHPDRVGGSGAQMAALNEAFEVLSDTDRRRRYDRELRIRPRPERAFDSPSHDLAEATDHDPRDAVLDVGRALSAPMRMLTRVVPVLMVVALGVTMVGSVLRVSAVFGAGLALGAATLVMFLLMPFFAMSSKR